MYRNLKIDALVKLHKVVRKSDSVILGEFRYDAQNRRVYHTSPFADASTYGNTRRYVYNGAQMFAEYFNSSGELLHEQFVYGTYLDEVWVRERKIPIGGGGYNSEYIFFHHDPLYSVCGVTDTSGNLIEAYEYDPYGKRTVITDGPDPDALVNFTTDDIRDTISPRFVKPAFTGQRYDLESGLYYYKERYYHSGWGRFINRDPIGLSKLRGKYAYVASNPLNLLDPMGLWFLDQHRTITLTAFDNLMERNSSCQCKYNKKQIEDIKKGLKEGSTYPDTTWDSYNGRTRNVPLLGKEYKSSHYGKDLYWHAMRSSENSAQGLKDKIVDRIWKHMILSRNEKRNFVEKGFILGEALHTFEDTFNKAHVIREGNIIDWFQEYSEQDGWKHFKSDIDTSQPGYNNAITHVSELMDMVFCKESESQDMLKTIDGFMRLTPTVKHLGTHRFYEKKVSIYTGPYMSPGVKYE